MKLRFHIAAAVVCILLLSSCVVGPKYVKPTTPMTPQFKEPPPQSFKEGNGWKQAQPGDQAIRAKWWEIFGDPQLNALLEQVEPANQELKAAEARFREARAMIRFNRASLYPTISTGPSLGALRNSQNRPGFPPNLTVGNSGSFILPFDLSYEVDLWGRLRRSISAAQEEAQATAADLQTIRLSIQAEVAMDYFELRAADAQKAVLDETVKAFTEALRLTTNRFEGGVAAKFDVTQAQTQLETARVQNTDVTIQRAQYEHAIATLLGRPPAEFSIAFDPLKIEPPRIPVGVPSQLLERRPDIASLERRMAEANEQIGIARAAFFPTVMLGASGGFQGTSILNWFNWPSRFWSVGATGLQTIFDAGRRSSVSDATIAGYESTVANYRQTTLTAFQQVEDNLAALRILETEASQQRDAVTAAQESLQLATNRYTGGVDTYLQVVASQTAALENQRNEIDILRRRMAASVLLVKALGGGWDVTQLPTVADLR